MDKATKEKQKNLLFTEKQNSRKLDLLLAESERQAERLKNLKDSKLSGRKFKRSKSPKI